MAINASPDPRLVALIAEALDNEGWNGAGTDPEPDAIVEALAPSVLMREDLEQVGWRRRFTWPTNAPSPWEWRDIEPEPFDGNDFGCEQEVHRVFRVSESPETPRLSSHKEPQQ